jgi:DNA-binding NarL/FixJ family response regulator
MIGVQVAVAGVLAQSDLTRLAVITALHQAGIDAISVEDAPPAPSVIQHIAALIVDEYAAHGAAGGSLSLSIPCSKQILLTSRCDPLYVQRMIERGFSGYLYLGDSLVDRLPQAVKDVAENGMYLSPSAAAALARIEHYEENLQPRLNAYHFEVLSLMAQHWHAGRIAAHLGRTINAIYQVQRYLRNLFEVETTGELLERARTLGLLTGTNEFPADL